MSYRNAQNEPQNARERNFFPTRSFQNGYAGTNFCLTSTDRPCRPLHPASRAFLEFTVKLEIYGLIWLVSLSLFALQVICFYGQSPRTLHFLKTGRRSLYLGVSLPVPSCVWVFRGFFTPSTVTLRWCPRYFVGKVILPNLI